MDGNQLDYLGGSCIEEEGQAKRGVIMEAKTRRKYSRYFDHVPILYAGYDSKNYDKGVMRNSCMDGMYFESDSPIQPIGDLYIKIEGHRPGSDVPEQYKDFRAKVKWCRQVTADKMPCYGMGVQFTAKSHLSYGINRTDSDCLCDFCENRSSSKSIHQTETGYSWSPIAHTTWRHFPALSKKLWSASYWETWFNLMVRSTL
jgi:hypothetical protein